jgi:hypothetical protein
MAYTVTNRFALPLSAFVVAALVGCGESSTQQNAATKISTIPFDSSCSSWFGGGVAVAMCSDHGSQPLTIKLDRPGRSGSAPRIAQAMGSALRDGEGFEIGPTPSGAELLARVDVGSRQRVGTALFHVPPATHSQHLQLQLVAHGADVDAQLRLASGQKLEAKRIYLPAAS